MDYTKQKPVAVYGDYRIWEDPIYGDERELILTKYGNVIAQDQWEVTDYVHGIKQEIY